MLLLITAASNAYRALGFKPSADCIDSLVIGKGRKNGSFVSTEFTEMYLYEEMIFAINLAVEAESKNGFLENVIRITKRALPSDESISTKDVSSMMVSSGFHIAEIIFAETGIAPSYNGESFIEFANNRLNEYHPLFVKSCGNNEPLPDIERIGGLETIKHPFINYTKAVSNNFADTLEIDRNHPYHHMLLTLIIARHIGFIESSSALADM